MRIIILTYESYQSFIIVSGLVKEFRNQVAGIIQSSAHVPNKNILQSIFYLMRHTGTKFLLLKGAEIFLYKFNNLYNVLLNPDNIRRMLDLCKIFNIDHKVSKNINSNACLQKIKQWNPDIVVSVYLNQKIGSIINNEYTVINVHPSYLPNNRGLFPFFWSLVENDHYTGVSVHLVDENYDTGPIIAQRKIKINKNDSVFSLSVRCAEDAKGLLINTINGFGNRKEKKQQNFQDTSYHSWPTNKDFRKLKQNNRRYGIYPDMWRYLLKNSESLERLDEI